MFIGVLFGVLFEVLTEGLSELCVVGEFVATWENGYGFKMWKICRTLSNTRVCMWLNIEGSTRK